MNWTEVVKWGKGRGYKIVRKSGVMSWVRESDGVGGQESCLEDLVFRVFNEMTKYRWVEHQKNYRAQNRG